MNRLDRRLELGQQILKKLTTKSQTTVIFGFSKLMLTLTLEKASTSSHSLAIFSLIWVCIICCNPLCISTSQICTRCGKHKRSARTSTFSTGILSRMEQWSVYRYSRTAKKLWKSTPSKGI